MTASEGLIESITADQAIQSLRAAVEEKGADHTVEHCVYVKNGEPYCIIGTALVKLGWDVSVVAEIQKETSERGIPGGYEYAGVDTATDSRTIHTIVTKFDLIKMTPDALDVYRTAQRAQDGGRTWGEALHEAEQAYSSTQEVSA